ncbi:MAG: hypothetical protein HW407_2295 [Bacteroidetes bacterium]|nr:hypothetical protein [Bacteroidota bacterium]
MFETDRHAKFWCLWVNISIGMNVVCPQPVPCSTDRFTTKFGNNRRISIAPPIRKEDLKRRVVLETPQWWPVLLRLPMECFEEHFTKKWQIVR